MSNELNWLKQGLNSSGVNNDAINEYFKNNGLKNLELLKEKTIDLFKKEIVLNNTKYSEKRKYINKVYSSLENFRNNGTILEVLRLLEAKETTYSPYYTKIRKYVTDETGDIDSIYKIAISFERLLNDKSAKNIKHIDIYHYLLKKNVHQKTIPEKKVINKIVGDYLMFRQSNIDKKLINISHLKLRFNDNEKVYNFELVRRSSDGKETSVKGIFLQNTAATYIFLCLSKKEKEHFSFLETITIIKNQPLEEGAQEEPLIGMYNGQTVFGAISRQPFASRVVLIRVTNDDELFDDLNKKNLLRSHNIEEIKKEWKHIGSSNTDKDSSWGDTLHRINLKIPIEVFLKNIKNEIDEDTGLFLLKDKISR
ncbi:MAG: hypothetical protein KAG06_07935 [Methylococcales bacterium]|nr:hypothetical protein [Methylococcales bacterium]